MIAMAIISAVSSGDPARDRVWRCAIIMRDTRNIITIGTFAESDSSCDDVTLCNMRALSPPNLFCVITKRDKPAATKWKKISCNERSLLGILMNASILKPRH